jgi:hypothetical protein
METPLLFAVFACCMLIGAVLLLRARHLSLRYNAWTTRLRRGHPQINPPPTPRMQERNTTIMTWIFRLAGISLVLFPLLELIPGIHRK